MSSSAPLSQNILESMAVPGLEDVYLIGGFASRVTFYAQQHRAFNLIWALFEEGMLKTGREVGIVGAGLSGMTAAVAAAQKGCKVTLLEKAYHLMNIQRGNSTRFIHPRIYDWPSSDDDIKVESPDTDLPYLNWVADTTAGIVEELEAQWEEVGRKIEFLREYEVTTIRQFEGKPTILANSLNFTEESPGFLQKKFDCVILALGFGLERQLPPLNFRSYWENDGLHQPITSAQYRTKRWLVTGCGDGGLIDAIRLRLDEFDHTKVLSDLLSETDLTEVKKRLREIELKAIDHLDKGEEYVGMYLYQEYDGLDIPDSLISRLKSRLRRNTEVTLNSPTPNPLSLRASILNRFIIFLLMKYGNLYYKPGRVKDVKPINKSYQVLFDIHGTTSPQEIFYDDIVVRFGPEPVIQYLLPDEALKALQQRAAAKAREVDITQRKCWSEDFYPKLEWEIPKTKNTREYAERMRAKALKVLFDLTTVSSVSIGEERGRIVYVATLQSTTKRSDIKEKKTIAGLPVLYKEISEKAEPPKRLTPDSDLALACGSSIGVYLANDSSERQVKGFRSGTLGCFVKLEDGQIGFLSSNTFMAKGNRGALGSSGIYQFNIETSSLDSHVGTLTAFVPLDLEGGINLVDVAVATLDKGINYYPGFHSHYGLPQLQGIGEAKIGDRVFKVGNETGLTHGTIIETNVTVAVNSGSFTLKYDESFIIEGMENKRFSTLKDSGALVVREKDGVVLGLLHACSTSYTYACPIIIALDLLKCSLITP